MASRRGFLAAGAGAAAALSMHGAVIGAETVTLPLDNGDRPLAAFPQKRPLIVLTPRPPQLETPFAVFDDGVFTPNDAFFVRWHLANIPTSIDAAAHRIYVMGTVGRRLTLSVDDLRRTFPAVEIAAVNQCSGNSRGLFAPRVAGGQWANGAMGNARWKGARLRDILDRAGLQAGTKQIRFAGLDRPTFKETPAFVKALDVEVARNPDVIVAYEMNGAPLPVLNGFPVRLVVPGWYSTYWMKMLARIEAIDRVEDNFWMKTAYRVPDTPDNSVAPSDKGYATVPISRMKVRSFVTSVADGGHWTGTPQTLRGIAFDGGSGIAKVDYSLDGGATWNAAQLGRDYGTYSFRRWTAEVRPQAGQTYTVACRATAVNGATQTNTPTWMPPGYQRNVIETYKVTAG
ncbi:MAG: molybdopterin-dependent oxidoreductase [Candidatus Velthaea sp.]